MSRTEQSLGPVTEARFAETFSKTAQATLKAAADLLGVDTDTLKAMTDAGVVRAVRKGRLRSYTEHDLRAYLIDGPDAPTRERKPRSSHVARPKVVPFTQRASARR